MEFSVYNEIQAVAAEAGGNGGCLSRQQAGRRKHLVRQHATTAEDTLPPSSSSSLTPSPRDVNLATVFTFKPEYQQHCCSRTSPRPPVLSQSYRALSADCRPPASESATAAKIQRQKTAESAPSRVSSRISSRQQSLTQGPSRVTLIRGESCSLVDIPTYLSSSVELGGTLSNQPVNKLMFAPHRPRLQIDLTRKKPEKDGKKTQWTVLCVAIVMMTMCVMLVGTMLSITTEYQVN